MFSYNTRVSGRTDDIGDIGGPEILMANEEKKTVEEVVEEEQPKVLVTMTIEKGKDGRLYRKLQHHFTLRGINQVINLQPIDIAGWALVEVVFKVRPQAELVYEKREMSDDSGKKAYYFEYYIQDVDDESGELFQVQVKPREKTDKLLLKKVFGLE